MACLDYDTRMVDCRGRYVQKFTSPCGVVVQIYKNWVDVSDRKAWRARSGFTGGLVMRVTEGRLDYQDVSLAARLGPQRGIYAAVWLRAGSRSKSGVVGCGVPEDDRRGRRTGLTLRSVRWFRKSIRDEEIFPDVPDFLQEAAAVLTPTFIQASSKRWRP